jgi:hypothetical protein
MSNELLRDVTGEQVAEIFNEVEDRVSDARSKQGTKRLFKIGALVSLCTAVATAASVALASFGFKLMGPPAEIAAARQDITMVRGSVTALQVQVDSILVERDRFRLEQETRDARVEAKISLNLYLACVLVRKQDPTLVPPDCNR